MAGPDNSWGYPGQSDYGNEKYTVGRILGGHKPDLAWPAGHQFALVRGRGSNWLFLVWVKLSLPCSICRCQLINESCHYYNYCHYYFIIIFIISHLDPCFTNDRILKLQIPKQHPKTEKVASLCLDFVSTAAGEAPWKSPSGILMAQFQLFSSSRKPSGWCHVAPADFSLRSNCQHPTRLGAHQAKSYPHPTVSR